MYAVVRTGGKQYRVEAGSTLVVEKLVGEPGSPVTFDRVLLVGDGEAVTVGNPTVSGATVSGTVLGESLGAKIVVFKFKQKVKYRRRTGHRQRLTRVRIDAITASGKTERVEALPEPRRARASQLTAAPAGEPAAKSKPRTRANAPKSDPAEAPKAAETATSTADKLDQTGPARRTRAKATTAAAKDAKAAASASEQKPKPRARRGTKPTTESAKEE